MPERDTTRARPGATPEWACPSTTTNGGARRGFSSDTDNITEVNRPRPADAQERQCGNRGPPEECASCYNLRSAAEGGPTRANQTRRSKLQIKSTLWLGATCTYENPREATPRTDPACGNGRHQGNPHRYIGGVGPDPSALARAGRDLDPPRNLAPSLTRWQHGEGPRRGLANQVPGFNPRRANIGIAAGGASSWEVEPKHSCVGLCLSHSSAGSTCRQAGGGRQWGWGTKTILGCW